MKPWPSELPPLPAATPIDRPVALLLRHAERPPLAPGEHGTDLALTAHGRRCAELLGATLGPRILSISTSPVRRCRETADAIRRSANLDLDIIADPLLGDPGIFVVDPALAWHHWQTLGHQAVLEYLAHAEQPLPGLAPAGHAARQLIAHMARSLDAPPGLHIFVTHDAILYPTVARLLPSRPELHRSPAPLAVTPTRQHPPQPGQAQAPSYPDFLESAALFGPPAAPTLAYRQALTPPILAASDPPAAPPDLFLRPPIG